MKAITAISKGLLVVFSLLVFVEAAAAAPTVDAGKDRKLTKEQGLSIERTKSDRDGTSARVGDTNTTSTDDAATETIRHVAQLQKSGSLDTTIDAAAGFHLAMQELEASGVEPWATCRVVSQPRLPADFNLATAVKRQGTKISMNRVNMLKSAAENNVDVSMVTAEAPIRDYRDCLAFYGQLYQRSFRHLGRGIAEFKSAAAAQAKAPKKGKKKSGGTSSAAKAKIEEIREFGYNDYLFLSKGALASGLREMEALDPAYQNVITDNMPCRFQGSLTNIQCGQAKIGLEIPPVLVAGGVTLFGNGSYGGFSAQYKISSGWSYVDAFDAVKSHSQMKRFAHDEASSSESSSSIDNSVKALFSRKKTVDMAKSAKTGINPASYASGGGN